MISRLAFLLATLAAAGCATSSPKVNIIPREDGSYYAIAYSSAEDKALDAAVQKGNQYCESKSRQFVLAKDAASTGSLAEDAKKATELAKSMIGEVLGKNMKSDSDQRIAYVRSGDELVVTFKCVKVSDR